jgi:hypothetical protein
VPKKLVGKNVTIKANFDLAPLKIECAPLKVDLKP